jgi:hypothetical protein
MTARSFATSVVAARARRGVVLLHRGVLGVVALDRLDVQVRLDRGDEALERLGRGHQRHSPMTRP